MKKVSIGKLALSWAMSLFITLNAAAQADSRISVKTADDLPRHSYKITGKALDLLTDDARFNTLLNQGIADALGDLQKYKIEDPSTLRAYYDFLQISYLVKGDLKTALLYSDKSPDQGGRKAHGRCWTSFTNRSSQNGRKYERPTL